MSSTPIYEQGSSPRSGVVREGDIEGSFIGTLQGLKYEYRDDIRDRAGLEANFRKKFEALNRVHLTDGEFARLLDEITTFKVSTLVKDNPNNEKCLFVDRKDLEGQSREDWGGGDKTSPKYAARSVAALSANQFNRFQEGCVEEEANTAGSVLGIELHHLDFIRRRRSGSQMLN